MGAGINRRVAIGRNGGLDFSRGGVRGRDGAVFVFAVPVSKDFATVGTIRIALVNVGMGDLFPIDR